MKVTVYILAGQPDTEKAKAELESIGWKSHGIVTFETSMGIEMDVIIMLKESPNDR